MYIQLYFFLGCEVLKHSLPIANYVCCPLQEWQDKAKEAKLKYDEAMKVYKESKANEPDDSPEESKPEKKKGSVKEFFGKKDSKKKSSPRKSGGGESQKFKSAEFVDTDDSSSEDEGKVIYVDFVFLVFLVDLSDHHLLDIILVLLRAS